MRAEVLRKKYPKFIYHSFSCRASGKDLKIIFEFEIHPANTELAPIFFNPELTIKNTGKINLNDSCLKNLAFNLGLIEMFSYWKTVCSPELVIEAGLLNKEQEAWWRNLIISGMGQFFWQNKINWKAQGFLKITSSGPKLAVACSKNLKDRYLVPFAGGRDSIVTLEKLKSLGKNISLFTVNPIKKIQKTAKVSGIEKQIIVERKIDKRLLEMNKKEFLNGHTPFTALLSFIAVLCSAIFDYKHIVFSNEKSAGRGECEILGNTINHQWAKSLEFEKKFKEYSKKYLLKGVDYFSYLRGYGELEISKMLTKYPQYFPVFSSCNAGMKMNAKGTLGAEERWCGNCPKCLFVYLSLYPFLKKEELKTIFGKDIFENKELLPVLKELTGKKTTKPMECVGTKSESRKALRLSLKKARKAGEMPYLLTKVNFLL